MPTIEELSERIERLESEQRGKWRFALQYLGAPLVLLIIGYLLNQSLEGAKQEFLQLQVEVKQIEAAQKMLAEIFSEVPERAFIADRLMSKLVDEALSNEISDIVQQYYSQKLDRPLTKNALRDIEDIVSAAEAIGGRAAEKIKSQVREKQYYVVVASIIPENRDEAIRRAELLRRKGYDSEVHYSTTGYYAVTIGHLPLNDAKALRNAAVDGNDAPDDSYLIPGTKFTEKIYPE